MQTTEERMALIRAAAKKFQKKQNRAARFTRQERVAPKRAKKKESHEYAWAHSTENVNHWTDSEAYANKYYGEVAFETTRFDNEWD